MHGVEAVNAGPMLMSRSYGATMEDRGSFAPRSRVPARLCRLNSAPLYAELSKGGGVYSIGQFGDIVMVEMTWNVTSWQMAAS